MQNEDTAINCENSSQQSLGQPECHSIASDDVALLRSQLAEQQRELDRLTVECQQLSSESNVGRVTLQELEARYDTMVDGALQGIIIHQDSVICFANQSAARIFDYASPDELLGRDFFELLVIPDERLSLRARTETLYRGGVHPSLANWRALSRDGRERWVTTTARLLAWGGRPAAVVFFQDITEERRAVQTLQEREALLHSITDHTDDIIFIKDRDSRILFLNPAGFRTSGLSPSKVLGHTDAELFPDQALAAAYRTADLRVMESRRAERIEEELPTADGQRRLFLTHKTPRFNSDGDVIGVLGVTRDITEERRLQREVLEIAAAENRRIGQDLHDGAGQQLTGLAYMAEALQNQLREKALPETQLAERLVATVKKAQALIRGYSRGLIPVDIDAEGLRFAIERLAADTESASGIHCTCHCPQLVRIENNHVATQLYRIAQESVTNALRHANAKHIALELTADKTGLRLSILDDGIGLPSESSSDGFGLRIMQYRAGLMGASLHIQPELPQGTRITCKLPINVSAD